MSKAIIMPRFGFTQEDATIVTWLVKEGTRVEKGDPICEVTTDKVNMEVEATADGILSNFQYQEGDTVLVTKVIAYILEGNETPGQPAPSTAPQVSAPVTSIEKETVQPAAASIVATPFAATPVARRMAAVEGVPLESLQGSGAGGLITREDVKRALSERQAPATATGKVSATPAARRLAAQYGIPLHSVPGTGLEGRVQGWDVEAYHQHHSQARPAAAPMVEARPAAPQEAAPEPQAPASGVEIIPLEGMRRTIADRLTASYQQAPHIFLDMQIDMGRSMALREALNPRRPEGRAPISLTALIVKACALALRQQPLLNSHFRDEKIYRYDAINIGMAVALESGLIVPVIANADQKNLNELGDEVNDLSQRAREGKLRPKDVADGTFTISNLGMFGIDRFTAIINPPQVGILAVGRVARQFVPGENDQTVARSLMTASLSADHRVIDGLVGARFLAALRELLESPNLLLES
jgi:pyruvate dehydrogenase E2 component (dihydrolipoamide acetyltransferase)